jgi:DNA-binding CsgD family transcriptional regulator
MRGAVPFPLFLIFLTLPLAYLTPQVASRVDDGGNVQYYATLGEAFAVASGASIDAPDEITLLTDVTLSVPVLVDEPKHIVLVSGGGSHTIMRGSNNISDPLFRVTGEEATLSLGKPGMEYELFIDGGYLATPSIQAEAPLVVINGPDAKLIMYDKVTIQNNYNGGNAEGTSEYQNGAGVFIRTTGNNAEKQTEFIMKGGTVRGNINNTQNGLACGGGVVIMGLGIFTMEEGTIAANTAYLVGGGFHAGSRGSFKKTGGIIYGNDSANELENRVINGAESPKVYGNAVSIAQLGGPTRFRDDTVTEDSRLSYTGHPLKNGVFGSGEKWSIPRKPFRGYLIPIAVVPVFLLLFLLLKRKYSKKISVTVVEKMELVREEQIEKIVLSDTDAQKLSPREKEILVLLLKNFTLRQISLDLHISYNTVNTHYNSIYRKLGVSSRGELLTKYGSRY